MAKWQVGDYIKITSTHKYADGFYGGYVIGDIGYITKVTHNYLVVTFESRYPRPNYTVLKRECTKTNHFNRVLERIKLLHSRQSLKHPYMEKKYARILVVFTSFFGRDSAQNLERDPGIKEK